MESWEPDFRAEAMDTPEGKGLARGRYDDFMDENLEQLVDRFLDWNNPPREMTPLEEYDELIRDHIAEVARADSELIGFWVAWHLAGGFAQLEASGWHRATIYRKLHRFRVEFGEHPDEYVFPYITLDLAGYWTERVRQAFEPATEAPDQLDQR
jgi:hypothetical protein